MVSASGGLDCGLLFSGAPFFGGELSCATIESWVCLETSAANSFASIVERIAFESAGGGEFPANCAASTFTPRTLPEVNASAKFMRFSSADEFTQVSAFME